MFSGPQGKHLSIPLNHINLLYCKPPYYDVCLSDGGFHATIYFQNRHLLYFRGYGQRKVSCCMKNQQRKRKRFDDAHCFNLTGGEMSICNAFGGLSGCLSPSQTDAKKVKEHR